MSYKGNYSELKQNALKKYFSRMNKNQQEAVFTVKGPILILAGAGSGKTTVLVNRIANMIYFGNAYNSNEVNNISENDAQFLSDFIDGKTTDAQTLRDTIAFEPIKPWNILAITFTNKAAGELKERLENMLGESGNGIVAATFHSACVRILRREIERLGYKKSFTIYDTDDTQRLIKTCMEELELSDKMFPPRSIQSEIGRLKDKMISPKVFELKAVGDYRKVAVAKIYKLYQSKLFEASALDFDDIIGLTVKLFDKHPDVLSHYQNLYKYILVDEYQDTNMVQFKLVNMLSSKHGNLCVVGDDDQSIYKFRGATIENILSFEEQYDDAKVIRLEENYRSTQNILAVANELIKNNRGRKGKNLWTSGDEGSLIKVYKAGNESSEAKFVSDTILDNVSKGSKYNDHAILYRTNAQSNAMEKALISSGIAYRIFGGLKFYDRKEIKDIIAYLAVIENNSDLVRFNRIVNEPKRGIGNTTLTVINQIASDLGITPIEVLNQSEEFAPIAKKASKLVVVGAMFDELIAAKDEMPLDEFLDLVLEKTGYLKMLKSLGEEGTTKIENVNELKSSMINYQEEADEPSLGGFLEEVALFTDTQNLDQEADYAVLMTMHAAKGLEFDNVFLVGVEEGIFPGTRSMDSEDDIEEERRLAYVAVTRAKKNLYISYAIERMLYGRVSRNIPSRFLKEMPSDYLEHESQRGFKSSNQDSHNIQSTTNISLQAQLAKKRMGTSGAVKNIDFAVGDRVKHNIFGEGTVLVATKMSNDTMLEVAFDTKGTKKIMANFAKLNKI